MKKANNVMGQFDEYQLMVRYKYGYQAFCIMIGLLIFLGIFDNLTYTLKALILFAVSMMYFFTRVVFSNAYTGRQGKAIPLGIIFIATGVMLIAVTFNTPNRMIEGSIAAAYTVYTGIIILIKEYLNRKKIEE